MVNCVAVNCKNISKDNCKVSFHSFPLKNKPLLRKWVAAMRRDEWTPSKWSKLCSKHFATEAFQVRPNAIIPFLKHDAVPSIFNFSELLVKSRKRLSRKNNDATVKLEVMDLEVEAKVNLSELTVAVPTHVEVGTQVDGREPPAPTHTEIGTQIDILRPTPTGPRTAALRRKIKNLKAQIKRKDKKCTTLQETVDQLRRNKAPELVNFLGEKST